MEKFAIDSKRQRYPYCIVWTPLPLITALIPFIGHTGICDAEGVIHDFAGDFTVSVDDMAFGNPVKYIPLDPSESERSTWESAISEGDDKFSRKRHNLAGPNCHSHVA